MGGWEDGGMGGGGKREFSQANLNGECVNCCV